MQIVECARCKRRATKKTGYSHYCLRCWRINCMRETARAKNKTVPEIKDVEHMLSSIEISGMNCPHCCKRMVLTGPPMNDVVSLQHDRSGRVRLVCMECNNRHDSCPGDTFWDHPTAERYCPKCDTWKDRVSDFYKRGDRERPYCKACKRKINVEYWKNKAEGNHANSEV